MHFSEFDTRAKLVDPALHARGWTEYLIRYEGTANAIEIMGTRQGNILGDAWIHIQRQGNE